MDKPGESTLLRNASVLDTLTGAIRDGLNITISHGVIRKIDEGGTLARADQVYDLTGHVVMPGLIDAHVHVMASTTNLADLAHVPPSFTAAHAKKSLESMLARGFTTVRDAGGADWGLAQAVRLGLFRGPRIYFSGLALAQTGGQGDFRSPDQSEPLGCPNCHAFRTISRVVDGPDALRIAARHELRQGANQIKVMAGGGIAGGIPIDRSHFTVQELEAVVEEARSWGSYVMAHAYAPDSIRRAVQAGVRTIEHGNLVDVDTAEYMAAEGVFMVPTLAIYEGYYKHAEEIGVDSTKAETIPTILREGIRALKICKEAGVKVGFGTDLEGILQQYQLREFSLRSQALPALDIVSSATTVNAEILQMEGKLGVVAEGAIADLLVLPGNPLDDMSLLQDEGKHIAAIMKDGVFEKNELSDV